MTNWTFATTNESWSTDWYASDGHTANGCLMYVNSASSVQYRRTGLSEVLAAGANLSGWVRVIEDATAGYRAGTVTVTLRAEAVTGGSFEVSDTFVFDGVAPAYDSGWVKLSTTSGGDKLISQVNVTLSSAYPGEAISSFLRVDDVYIGEVEPDASAAQLRYLGMDADGYGLYLTAVESGTLSMFTYELATMGRAGTATFGAADYAAPDTFTNAVYPRCKPGADKVLYVYGRDGNNKQVQYNDTNGTLGWIDVGPGTATWGTAKFAVACLPDAFNPADVIVAFYDDDVYRSNNTTGTSGWTKAGDATSGLRGGLRVLVDDHELLLAGTAAGTVHYSPNYGVSYGAAGGTAMGTVRWLAESY